MMLAELIDGEDFRRRLAQLGISVPEDADPDSCARIARLEHQEAEVPGLDAVVRELMQRRDVILPSVREAIERHLLTQCNDDASRPDAASSTR